MFNLKNGFSLTELMVSLGVLSILLLMGSGVLSYMTQAAGTADKMSDMSQLAQEAQDLMSNATLCSHVVGGIQPTVEKSLFLSDKIKPRSPYSKNIEIDDIKIVKIDQIKDQFYRAQVRVTGFKKGLHVGSEQFAREVSFFYELDKNLKISNCVGETQNPVTNCTVLGGNWDSSYSRCDFCHALGGERIGSVCKLKTRDTITANCPVVKIFQDEDCSWPSRQQAVQFIQDLSGTAMVEADDVQAVRSALLSHDPRVTDPQCSSTGSGADLRTSCLWNVAGDLVSYSSVVFMSTERCQNSVTVSVACPP